MHAIFTGQPVALTELLARREARALQQRTLLAAFGLPVVCFCINMPGPVKQNAAARQAFAAGRSALRRSLFSANIRLLHTEERHAATGCEALLITTEEDALVLKRLCSTLEDSSPLGRLWDMDVIGPDGRPIPRTALGLPARACMVCGGNAAACSGRAVHSPAEVEAALLALLQA